MAERVYREKDTVSLMISWGRLERAMATNHSSFLLKHWRGVLTDAHYVGLSIKQFFGGEIPLGLKAMYDDYINRIDAEFLELNDQERKMREAKSQGLIPPAFGFARKMSALYDI